MPLFSRQTTGSTDSAPPQHASSVASAAPSQPAAAAVNTIEGGSSHGPSGAGPGAASMTGVGAHDLPAVPSPQRLPDEPLPSTQQQQEQQQPEQQQQQQQQQQQPESTEQSRVQMLPAFQDAPGATTAAVPAGSRQDRPGSTALEALPGVAAPSSAVELTAAALPVPTVATAPCWPASSPGSPKRLSGSSAASALAGPHAPSYGSGPALAPRKPRAQRQVDALQQEECRERRKSERRLSKGAQIAWSTCQIIESRELKLQSSIGSGAYGKVCMHLVARPKQGRMPSTACPSMQSLHIRRVFSL